MKYPYLHITNLFSLAIVLLLSACAKTSINEIPSYIAVDTVSMSVSNTQGTASQKISDVWIYADNELIGAFEVPAKFPLLKSGTTQISIFAGIKLNGINETRAPYPFYNEIKKTLNLEREKVDKLGHLKFSYVTGTKFAWQENFEEVNLSIDSTSRSEVNLVRTRLPELAAAFPSELNEYAAKVVIPNDTLVFECASHDYFVLPTDGKSIFLELNYKSNNAFTVGVLVIGSVTTQEPILIVNPSSTWNKIYINLTPTVSSTSVSNKFKVFIKAIKSTEDTQAEILFDNIKLLHF